MKQYQIEAQAAMTKYETEANRQTLLAQLEQQAAELDYKGLLQDYISQYGQRTTQITQSGEAIGQSSAQGAGGILPPERGYTGGYTDAEMNWIRRHQPMDYHPTDWKKIDGKWWNTHQRQRILEGELPDERKPSGLPLPLSMWGRV